MVRETSRVDWTVTPTALEAGVRELREIRTHRPRYNRRSKLPERQVHLKLTAEAFPRLSVVSSVREDGATYLAAVGTRRTAERLADAVHDVTSLRQCTTRLRLAQDHATCVLKELERCASPCDGTISRAGYGEVADQVAQWLDGDATDLLDRLRARMTALADRERYEDAAVARARLHLVARTLARARRLEWVARVDELVVVRPGADAEAVRAVRGRVTATLVPRPGWADHEVVDRLRVASAGTTVAAGPPDAREVEEVDLLLGWLDAGPVRPLVVVGEASQPVAGGRGLADALHEARRLGRQLRRDRLVLRDAKVAATASAE